MLVDKNNKKFVKNVILFNESKKPSKLTCRKLLQSRNVTKAPVELKINKKTSEKSREFLIPEKKQINFYWLKRSSFSKLLINKRKRQQPCPLAL